VQLGAAVDVGRRAGVRAPLNEQLVAVIHDLEDGRREMRRGNLDELRRLDEELYH